METLNKHAPILNGVIVELRIGANDIYTIAEDKAEQNALVKIADRLRSMAESLESIRHVSNNGKR